MPLLTSRLFLSTALLSAFPLAGIAQDEVTHPLPQVVGAEQVEEISRITSTHPAVDTLIKYLKASISNNVAEAVEYIDDTSVSSFKFRTLNAVQTQINAVPLPSRKKERERDILKELGFDSIAAMEAAEPKEFYIKVNNQQVASDPAAAIMPTSTVNVQILGLAGEDHGRTVHFITRTSHREEVMLVSTLRLTSMVKAGLKWNVSLQAQQPRLEPLSDDIVQREKDEMANDPELKRLEKLLETRETIEKKKDN